MCNSSPAYKQTRSLLIQLRNLDRLIAIWQAIHPDSYTTPEAVAEATFTYPIGTTVDISTPLAPFHPPYELKTFYTSATVRFTRTFGYTYPEIVDWKGQTPSELSSTVRANFEKLYNRSRPGVARGRGRKKIAARNSLNSTANATGGDDYEYFINVRVAEKSLSDSYFIHFFLGKPELEYEAGYSWAKNLIGSFSALNHGSDTSTTAHNMTDHSPRNRISVASAGRSAGQKMRSTIQYSQVPLTHALFDNPGSGMPNDLHPSEVIPYLKANLRFKIQYVNDTLLLPNIHGHECSPLQRSLRMFVVGRSVEYSGSDAVVQKGRFKVFREVTEHWPLGRLGKEEEM